MEISSPHASPRTHILELALFLVDTNCVYVSSFSWWIWDEEGAALGNEVVQGTQVTICCQALHSLFILTLCFALISFIITILFHDRANILSFVYVWWNEQSGPWVLFCSRCPSLKQSHEPHLVTLSPFFRWENWGLIKLNDLSKTKHQLLSETRVDS